MSGSNSRIANGSAMTAAPSFMRRRRRGVERSYEDDPTAAMTNLFDLAILIGVGLLIFALTSFGLRELLSPSNLTIVKNPGKSNMEIITKKKDKIERLKQTGQQVRVEGNAIGTVYQLPSGEVVWLPTETGK